MISIKHLRMEYGETVAIENLQLEIDRGEVFGLIGPNDAGKTTLIRILATLLEPTCGQITIDGVDLLAEPLKIHPLIGYMSECRTFLACTTTCEFGNTSTISRVATALPLTEVND